MDGDSDAQFDLGVMCAKRMGVPKSGGESIKWYRKSAAQGGQEAKDRLKERGVK